MPMWADLGADRGARGNLCGWTPLAFILMHAEWEMLVLNARQDFSSCVKSGASAPGRSWLDCQVALPEHHMWGNQIWLEELEVTEYLTKQRKSKTLLTIFFLTSESLEDLSFELSCAARKAQMASSIF